MRKQKKRITASLERRRQRREPYDLVLIVCEGAKTEPLYFSQLRDALRLSRVNVSICGKECGSSPLSVVDYALAEFEREGDYDRIFCVFDKDRHAQYKDAVIKVQSQQLPDGSTIEAITSVPCFEFWLLLHFKETAKPYSASGKKSACDNIIRDLKAHMPHYKKGNADVFAATYPFIDEAIKRAERLEKRQKEAVTDNPSTKVHRLVGYMQTLKNKSEKQYM
jgi:hypothetical protein